MIQDISPSTYHNEFRNIGPAPEDIALVYRGNDILIGGGEGIVFPRVKDFPGAAFQYLFSIDEQHFFLLQEEEGAAQKGKTDGAADLPAGFRFEDARRFLRGARPKMLAFAGTAGHQLALWYRQTRFCGACGAKTVHSERERAKICPVCGLTVYPDIHPAVIVAVMHAGRLLMTKYAGRSFKNYALIAGYNEIGETIEQTVRREVMEEVGLPVKNLRYYKSQPWTFSGSLLMGFFCELDGDIEDITLDRDELAEGGWYTPEEVPDDAEQIALTAEMMMVFKRGEVEKVTRSPLHG